jgi:hypothetical protein
MSSLADRREHRYPSTERLPPRPKASWHDFAATLTFIALGMAVTLWAVSKGIPLVGDDIWSG